MAKGRKNQGRRVQPTLAALDAAKGLAPAGSDPAGRPQDQTATVEGIKQQVEWYGKVRAQVVDIASQMENIFTLNQQNRMETDQIYGIEKKMLRNMGFMANQVKLVALQKELILKHSLEDANILAQTINDYQDYNRQARDVAAKTKEL